MKSVERDGSNVFQLYIQQKISIQTMQRTQKTNKKANDPFDKWTMDLTEFSKING